jgi:surface antigen
MTAPQTTAQYAALHVRRTVRSPTLAAAMLVASLLVATNASAANLGFLARGPMARFNDADMQKLRAAVGEALEAKETGTEVGWSNEKTGASGEITPLRIFDSKKRPCRELKVVNRHKQLQASGVYTLCRQDGRWRLEP